MKKTDRGKKKKSLGVKQAAFTRNLAEDQRAIVKKPLKVQPSAVEPANKKNRVGMYEPNMQNFVMPCTQRHSNDHAEYNTLIVLRTFHCLGDWDC